MEMKTKEYDLKHIIIISISIIALIISFFNASFAYFADSKNNPITLKSTSSFGESTVHDTNVFLEGNLSYTNKLKNNSTLSFVKDNVDDYDYLLSVATQVDPHITEYESNEYTNISYEIFHKTEETLDTTIFTCNNNLYNNGTTEDYCNKGTFIENSLNGLPFELIKDFRITDTNTHYFDVYIYLNNETESKMFKTRIFYVEKETEKEVISAPEYLEAPDIDNTGLVPIKYNETSSKWVVTTQDDPEWYNYNEQKWANAAILKNKNDTELILPDGDTITESQSNVYAMFVWIPRFSYTIGCLNSDTTCYGYRLNDNPDTDPGDPTATLPGAIDIKFVSKEDKLEIPDMDNGIYPNYTYTNETDRTPSNYYTHPAFWWDENGDGVRPEDNSEELAGIWVGKFETSTNSSSTCYSSASSNNCDNTNQSPRILPNVISLRYQTVSNQFATAQKFSVENNIYGIDNTKTDGHMMKNSEWSAVAYLSQSIYGKYGNKDYSGANKEIYINNYSSYYTGSYYTGISAGAPSTSSSSSITCRYNVIEDRGSGKGACGAGASTTGNIYGVYDMSGGAYEYVMGNYNNVVSSSGVASSWFTTTSNIKYYDKFTKTAPFTTKNKETIGQSLYEVSGWYGDYADTFGNTFAWLLRGGDCNYSSSAGAFNGVPDNGIANYYYGFRSVFVMTIA